MTDVGVLTVVVGGLVVVLAVRVMRHVRGRRVVDPFTGMPVPGSRIGVAWTVVTVVALLVAGAVEGRHQWVQARATQVVREVSGVPGAVARCQRFTPALLDLGQDIGHVQWDQPTVAYLDRDVCGDLAGWLLAGADGTSRSDAVAVHVLVHEAVHVGGERDEARTECVALQLDAQAAVTLGASPATADALAAIYLGEVYPTMPTEYVSGSCAPDGPWDLTPGDGRFP